MTEPFFAPRFEVRLSGTTLAADLAAQVTSLVVETDLDMAGTFALTLHNPDNTLLDSALLDLGRTVEIHLGYGAELVPAFLGEVAAIEPSFPRDGAPTIRVTGYDKSQKMRRSQPEPTEYRLTNDSAIAAAIAAENGLIPVVDPTPGIEEQRIKVESDMAFLKMLAEKHFFDVYVEWDRLHFQYPRPQLAAHVLEWGRNLSAFEPRISAAGLAGLQVVRGYNQELAQTISVTALATDFDVDDLKERLGGAALDLVAGLMRKGIRQENIDNPLDAAVLAKSLLANLLEGMYEGQGSCVGLPDLTAGRYVEIRGVGKRFGGTYRLRKVAHRIDDSGFRTDFSITQRDQSSLLGLLRDKAVAAPAPNTAPPFYGVVLATVIDNDEVHATPAQVPLGRVRLKYDGMSEGFTSLWAPCVRPMAGDRTGFYALPEKGEQVLVAFEHGDLRKPYVLGALWSAQQPPPLRDDSGTNAKRVFRTRSGHKITFDDTKGAGRLVIEDGGGSSITMNSKDGSMTIAAKGELTIKAKGRTIAMTEDGVDVT